MKKSIPTSLALLLATSALATAASIPYTNNFDGTGGNVAFATENTDPQWTVGSGVYTNSITGGGGVNLSAVNQFTDMTNASFTISSQFKITSMGTLSSTGTNVTIGFSIFGQDAAVSSAYLADLSIYGGSTSTRGEVRLVSVGTPGTALASTSASTGLTTGLPIDTVYTLKLDVVNTGAGAYTLTLGLYNAAGTTLQGSAVTAGITGVTGQPSGGYYSGYRNRTNISSGTNTVEFDNYSIVPEPTTFAMLLGGLGLLAMRRGRRG